MFICSLRPKAIVKKLLFLAVIAAAVFLLLTLLKISSHLIMTSLFLPDRRTMRIFLSFRAVVQNKHFSKFFPVLRGSCPPGMVAALLRLW